MEHIALYRQFRPQTFDEMVEQEAPVAALKQSVITGRIGHAYLFCGQRGTGKTSIARIFSRAINCENPVNGNPCNICPTCKGISDSSLMDVIEIDAASNRSIENIRKICEEVNYTPTKAKYKVYIIDEVHMITGDAFNALLKTLEEPPAHAVFLFATTDPQKIPATILSRCQRYDFRRISTGAISSRLRYICDKEGIKADDDALALVASLSDGAMRDAISVLDQAASACAGKSITAEFIEAITGTVNASFLSDMARILIEGKFDQLLVKTQELSDSGNDLIQFTLDLAAFFRNLLVIRTVPDPSDLIPASPATLKKMYEIANLASAETLVVFISSLSKLVSDLKWTPSVKTTFEIGLLRFCGRRMKTDVVPLTVPDFYAKQKEAVQKTDAVPAVGEIRKADTPDEKKTEAPEPETSTTENTVASSADVKSDPLSSIKAKLDLMKSTLPAPSAPKPEPAAISDTEMSSQPAASEAPQFPDAPEDYIPPEPPPADPGDIPLDNQMDIFSMEASPVPVSSAVSSAVPSTASAPSASPEHGKVPEDPETANNGPKKKGILADLSDSFLDDIVSEVQKAPETQPPLYEPTGRIGETKKTALSAALDNTTIAAVKNTDPAAVWDRILLRSADSDYVIYSLLRNASFRIWEDAAYIVVDDNDKHIISQLKKDQNFKKTSTEIKTSIQGINKVFLATESQYMKITGAVTEDGAAERSEKSGNQLTTEEFLRLSGQMGINTEIHFGDD